MIDTIIFDVGRVLVNWDYESYLKRFAFGPEKTKAIVIDKCAANLQIKL